MEINLLDDTEPNDQKSKNNSQSIQTLKEKLNPIVLEVIGKDYTDAYLRLLGKKYYDLLDNIITNNNINNNNNSSLKNCSSLNPYLSTSIRNSDTKNISQNNSTFWKDYNFVQAPKKNNNEDKNMSEEMAIDDEIKSSEADKNDEVNIIKNNNDVSYYNENSTYKEKLLLNNDYSQLSQINEENEKIKETDKNNNSEKKNAKIEEIKDLLDPKKLSSLREQLQYLYFHQYDNENKEEIKKNKKNKNNKNNKKTYICPEYVNRFVLMEQLRQEKLLEEACFINEIEALKMTNPKMDKNSKKIISQYSNYPPLYKRIDKVLKQKENNINELRNRVEKAKNEKIYKNYIFPKKSVDQRQWLKKMEDWNIKKEKKLNRIIFELQEIQKKEEAECTFSPMINNNAKVKDCDEGKDVSSRLYQSYFTRQKKIEEMIEKSMPDFTPSINK